MHPSADQLPKASLNGHYCPQLHILMKLLHISKPQRRSNFWDWEQSVDPFPPQLPPGFDAEALAASGTEPAWPIL